MKKRSLYVTAMLLFCASFAYAQQISGSITGVVKDSQQAAVVNMDETGWRAEQQRAWLWTAVAAALTLGVVDGFNSGIGGGCFLLIHSETGHDVAIDGRDGGAKVAFFRQGTATTPQTIDRVVHVEEVQAIAAHLGGVVPTLPGRLLDAVTCMTELKSRRRRVAA